MVVSEFGASDPRTKGAFDRITAVSDARILLLMVDPAAPARTVEDGEAAADAAREAATPDEVAA